MNNSKSIKTLYLAGPDVFYPDAEIIGEAKKILCEKYGMIGLHPVDNNLEKGLGKHEMASAIYQGNLAFMHQADAIVANITPFRGSGMDPGTAFEIGFFVALNKPVFIYSNDNRDYASRVERKDRLSYLDDDGCLIEDFDGCENLMITMAADIAVTPAKARAKARLPMDALVRFEDLLALIAKHNKS